MDGSGAFYDIEGDETYLVLDPHKVKQNPYQLIVYPNPAQDLVNIHLNGKTSIHSISVIDPQGRIIQNVNGLDTKHHEINTSAFPAGLYYVQVHHEHGMMTQLLSVIK
jgi:hypothetical protein